MAVVSTVLDHVAVATGDLQYGWDLFGGLLGGSWAYGGNDPGFWWGQLQFRSGPKIELLTPTGGPDAAFLDRFLSSRGPGPHHLNFGVTDIARTLSRVRALGIEPVQVSLLSDTWKEAFVHPRDAYGIVIQVAQQSGPPPQLAAPPGLPVPGAPCDFQLIEQRVSDIHGAVRLYAEALEGDIMTRHDSSDESVVELSWQAGTCLRLVQASSTPGASSTRTSGRLADLRFSRRAPAFDAGDLSRAADLSLRLGVSLDLRA
jgi:catechol 2,3-dioxygenase-like lactoylglutathione lyase family enzyme